jgi:thioredoxin-like negative regulator of GroEL
MTLVWAFLLCLFAGAVSATANSFLNIDASRLASLIRDNSINTDQLLVVMFFAPWADGYKLFLPDWTSLAAELASDKMVFATIDAVKHAQVRSFSFS